MRLSRRTFLVALILAVVAAATAAGRTIQTQVEDLIRGNNLGHTTTGICIVDLNDGSDLAAINADETMIPASNMKLITTAAALEVLGKDFKFRTQLRLIEASEWGQQQSTDNQDVPPRTSLLIRGDGDPAFGDPEVLREQDLDPESLLEEWVETVRNEKIEHVDQLIVDDRAYDQNWVHAAWPADQLTRHYCAQVAAINFHRNVLYVYPEPAGAGQTPHIQLRPLAPFVQTNNLSLTATRDNFQIDRKPEANVLTFRGTVSNRRTKPLRVTIHDPPIFFAKLLEDRLTKAGIGVGTVRRVRDRESLPPGKPLYEVHTTLYEVVRRCNTDSVNLYAEALIKRMGHFYTGSPGSWNNGASAIRQFLQKRLGTTAAVVSIADGSGLSRANLITARIMVRMLQNMYEDQDLGYDYIKSLSVGGVHGSLRKQKRFMNELKGKVYAKTGYIDGVSALSGYLIIPLPATDAGTYNVVAFSLLFNNIVQPVQISQIKNVQDRIVALIERSYRPDEPADQ